MVILNMSVWLGILTYSIGILLILGYPIALWFGKRYGIARQTTESQPPYEVQVEELQQ